MGQQKQEVEKWKTVYKEVRGALDFRVANLNSQQQRIANVLFANGLIFGFLGASAGIFFDSKVPKWPTSILYVASMCSLICYYFSKPSRRRAGRGTPAG